MSKLSYYTEAGLKKLKDELKELETVQRPAISQQIAEARDKGDLSENAEYDAAKEAQGLLEMKIAKLKEVVSNARIVDESEMDTSRALILSKVKIKNLNNNAEMEYQIVAENEANLKEKKISIDSPIGRGLLGKSVGDIANVLRIQLERQQIKYFPSLREYSLYFGITKKLLDSLDKTITIMHPGPINRGVELSSDVADSEHAIILNQVENGVAIRMAVLYLLASNNAND